MAGNKLPGNPSWPRIPEAALQLRALRNRHVSAITVINPPTAIYFSFQTTCESPELCVRVDPWQPQINITLCFMNEKKETQGIRLKAEQSKAGNSKRPGALLLAFNKRQMVREKGPGPELEDLSLTHTNHSSTDWPGAALPFLSALAHADLWVWGCHRLSRELALLRRVPLALPSIW